MRDAATFQKLEVSILSPYLPPSLLSSPSSPFPLPGAYPLQPAEGVGERTVAKRFRTFGAFRVVVERTD